MRWLLGRWLLGLGTFSVGFLEKRNLVPGKETDSGPNDKGELGTRTWDCCDGQGLAQGPHPSLSPEGSEPVIPSSQLCWEALSAKLWPARGGSNASCPCGGRPFQEAFEVGAQSLQVECRLACGQ